MEFDPSVLGSKAPRDGAALCIALSLQSRNAFTQDLHALDAPRQAAAGKNSDLDLGHIEPAPMFGGIMELDALQNASCFGRLEGFIQGSSGVRVQVILHDAHIFRLRIDRID